MNKFSRTARSVTFAAIVGLSMGVSAPVAIAQDSAINQAAGDSPLVNKDAKGSLTIHKFGNPTAEGQPSGTAADVEDVKANGGEILEGSASPSTRSTRLQMVQPTLMSLLMRGCWLLRS